MAIFPFKRRHSRKKGVEHQVLWPVDSQPILDLLGSLQADGSPYHDAPLPNMGNQPPVSTLRPEGYLSYNRLGKAQDEITDDLLEVLGCPSRKGMDILYEAIKKTSFRQAEFRLQEQIAPDHPQARDLVEFALWLLRNSPDPQPVKYALILLGALDERDHQAIYLTFAGHDAFTYQAQRALLGTRPVDDSRNLLLHLSKTLSGWGKIDAIIPLCEWAAGFYDTDGKVDDATLALRNEFRHWLVRGGYRNAINDELIAQRAAVFGDIEKQLAAPDAAQDAELIDHTTRIFTWTFYPRRWHDYEGEHGGAYYSEHYDKITFDFPERAVSIWLDLIIQHPLTWDRSCAVARIRADACYDRPHPLFLLSDDPTILPRLDAYLQNPDLNPLLMEKYGHEDPLVRREAVLVSDIPGIDYWPIVFDCIDPTKRQDDFVWLDLSRTEDPQRAEMLAGLLLRHLKLSHEVYYYGRQSVFRMLRCFPGVGWPLLAYYLQRPFWADEAANVLEAWPRDTWPSEAIPILRKALDDGAFSKNGADQIGTLLTPKGTESGR